MDVFPELMYASFSMLETDSNFWGEPSGTLNESFRVLNEIPYTSQILQKDGSIVHPWRNTGIYESVGWLHLPLTPTFFLFPRDLKTRSTCKVRIEGT